MDTNRLDLFLRNVLQQQIDVSSKDIRHRDYFHGQINRFSSEQCLQKEGQFLIRESNSEKNQFVLSCLSDGEHLHFIIHEQFTRTSEDEHLVQYYFDGDLFSDIPSLIDHYHTTRQPITRTSGAIIKEPIKRELPLKIILN